MMKENQKAKLNLSIHDKIRKAAFVPTDEPQTKRFKYFLNLFENINVKEKLLSLKRTTNKIIQKLKLWSSKVNWPLFFIELFVWILEAFIEGLTANFATHYLFNVKFNVKTIFAHGIIIKQGLDIWWRLRKYGPNSKIPKTNE